MKKRKTAKTPVKKTMKKTKATYPNILSRLSKRSVILSFIAVFASVGTYFLFFAKAETGLPPYRYPLVTSYDETYPPKLARAHKAVEKGTVTGYMFGYTFAGNTLPTSIHFHDSSNGNTSNVGLTGYNGGGQALWAKDNSLWVLGSNQSGIQLVHFSLNTSPLPTSASLLSNQSIGDSDTRLDDIIQLESGAIVALVHQQTAWKQVVYYLAPGQQTWQTVVDTSMYTQSSKARLIQHPADKTLWLFRDPDAWGCLEAAHFTEANGTLRIDWGNNKFIYETADGSNAPDGENPDIEVAPDSSTGEIVLAYQSRQRQMWFKGTGNYVYGQDFINVSYPVVTRIKTDQSKSFVTLPIYVERISALGLVVRPGEVWLAYRPVDQATYAFNQAYTSVYRNGVWESPVYLGQLHENSDTNFTQSWAPLLSGISRPEFILPLAGASQGSEGKINLISMLYSGTADTAAPTVSITTPTQNAIISGNVNVNVAASDNVGVTGVTLYLNNTVIASSNSSGLSYTLDTTTYANGAYGLVAKATDAAGNSSTTAVVNVTISNSSAPPAGSDTTAPTVTIVSPLNTSTISGTVNVSASAADNLGVASIELWIDGKRVTTVRAGSLNYSWNTRKLKSGTHTIIVKAYDAAGNVGNSSVTVTK